MAEPADHAALTSERIAFVHRKLSRLTGWLAFAAMVLPVPAYALLARLGQSAVLQAILDKGALLALPLAAVSYLAGRDLIGAPGSIRREGDDVVIERGGSALRFPASAVESGIIVPATDRVSVELHLRGGDQITARVDDVAEAEAVLRELRVGVENQRCRVQIADRTAARVVSLAAPVSITYFAGIWFAIAFGRYIAHAPGNALLVLALAFYASLAALIQTLISTAEVTVGTDGLAFRRGLRDRFIPFTELEDIRVAGLGALLVLRGGRRMLLPSIAGVSAARLDALKLRIREAMALRDGAPAQALHQLDRAGRPIAEWRAALGALARRGTDYRAAGLSAEDLEGVLGSADATPERRLAAALALAAGKHPTAPERIRVAAAQCASERLRVALEKVGEGTDDDDALAEALEEEEAHRLGSAEVVRAHARAGRTQA